MKIYGIFRGFPGLGRVMSGLSILSELKSLGHEVKAYSYLQGVTVLKDYEIEFLIDEQPPNNQIMAIGLNPICKVAGDIINLICSEKPELVIIDGEPLLISTLAMVFPRERILSLLNPADLYNPTLPDSTIKFYHSHYLSSGFAIVDGIDKNSIILPDDSRGCDILKTNTILRRDVIDTIISNNNDIVSVLGGGSSNASDSFLNSTIEMAKRILEAAILLPNESFRIYCNDARIANEILMEPYLPNVKVIAHYTSPKDIYSSAKVLLCRAGRNTISEILYHDIPAVLMSSSGDFRSSEQDKNIELACSLRDGRLFKYNKDENGKQLADKILKAENSNKCNVPFVPGNEEAMSFILDKINI